jgi:type II secretory ATPase GspE/PulE/Tfp pilus assembly ATPase PilB-like protein
MMELVVPLLAEMPAGPYTSVWKALAVVVVLLFWARLLAWVDKDAEAAHLPRQGINTGLFSWGLLAFLIFFLMPFLLGISALVVLLGVEFAVYLFIRHKKVGLGDLKQTFVNFLRGMFKREKVIEAKKGEVQVYNKAGAPLPSPESEDPNRPAYDAVQLVLTDPLKKGAERIELMPAEGAWGIRYWVDGVSYSGGSVNRNDAAAAVNYFKRADGLVVDEKRKPQTAMIRASVDKDRHDLRVITAGSTAGEFVRIDVDPKKKQSLKLADLGLSPEQLETIQNSIAENQGLVLVSAPKGQGLTTTLYGILRGHDAFLSQIITVERGSDQDLEGITQNKLSHSATPAEEQQKVAWVTSQDPDVVMVSDVQDSKSAADLIKFSKEKRTYVGMRAASTLDALAAWRKLVGDDELAMKNLVMVINSRVMRKLCMACKVGYAPDPQTLKKLNMDPDQISKLYQARTEPLRDAKGNTVACEFCKELRFHGRTGVYEILKVDDDVRQIVAAGGSPNQLKAVFRKQRSKYLQEQALALVEQGDTSIQEVLRVLRAGESSPPKPPAQPRPVA